MKIVAKIGFIWFSSFKGEYVLKNFMNDDNDGLHTQYNEKMINFVI